MTPLVLLIGFLGSGKTTFLRQILPELKQRGLTPHVVINDYQNARIDAAFLKEVTEFVKPISGSCVCCESSEELLNTFAEISLTPKSVLLLETNGTTDAEELLELLTLDSRVRRFTLPLQVTLIDAKRWQKRFWHNALERDQFKTSTHFLITRQDVVTAERLKFVEEHLRGINSVAVPVTPVGLCEELKQMLTTLDKISPRISKEIPGHNHADHAHNHEHDHEPHHHDEEMHHFASAELPLPPVVDRADFLEFLKQLPVMVLRAKGLVVLKDSPDRVHLFQRVEADEDVIFVPLKDPAPLPPVLILIGVNLPVAELRQQVSKL